MAPWGNDISASRCMMSRNKRDEAGNVLAVAIRCVKISENKWELDSVGEHQYTKGKRNKRSVEREARQMVAGHVNHVVWTASKSRESLKQKSKLITLALFAITAAAIQNGTRERQIWRRSDLLRDWEMVMVSSRFVMEGMERKGYLGDRIDRTWVPNGCEESRKNHGFLI